MKTVVPVVLLLAGCGEKNEAPAMAMKKDPLVSVAPVTKSHLARAVDLTGEVVPYRTARLASPAEGPIAHLRVRESDPVKTGDILLGIGRKKGIDALMTSLQEDLRKEEDNFRRTEHLVRIQALPGEQLDQAKTGFENAKAMLAKASETAHDYVIQAPWDGIVSRLNVKEGDFVGPRTALVEIYDPTSLIITAAVPEIHAAGIKEGMKAEIVLDAFPQAAYSGEITRAYPFLDEKMRTRTIELGLNSPAELLPGMFARIRLVMEEVRDAITVPTGSIIVKPSGEPVAFVFENGKAFERKVETGLEEGGKTQVLSGLAPGEAVIVSGQEKLKDGAPVRLPGANTDGGKKSVGNGAPATEKPQANPEADKQGVDGR